MNDDRPEELVEQRLPDWIWMVAVSVTVPRHGLVFTHQGFIPLFTSN